MSKIAFVFPGQGSQHAGMGRQLNDQFKAAKSAFDEAGRSLGFDVGALCFDGPEQDLQLTANTQPAILTTSVAALRVIAEAGVKPDVVAGHSLGEYSALVAAGSLTLADAARTVRLRGQFMQEAVPAGIGAMAAILGLDAVKVAEACAKAAEGQVCSPANFNTPMQTVIAGHAEAVERARAGCLAMGAKRAIVLKVSAPFHCALMMQAQERLASVLAEAEFRDLQVPLVNNVDAQVITSGADARTGLVRQVSSSVRWTETVHKMMEMGVDTVVELGPGKVLRGLVGSISREMRLLNVEDTASLNATLEVLKAEKG